MACKFFTSFLYHWPFRAILYVVFVCLLCFVCLLVVVFYGLVLVGDVCLSVLFVLVNSVVFILCLSVCVCHFSF